MQRIWAQRVANRIAAMLAPAIMPGGIATATAHTRDLQNDYSFDQLPSICRQDGGVPYVLYEFDDDGSVSHARTSCFGQTVGSWGTDWLCELDRSGEYVCIPLISRSSFASRGITPRQGVTIVESWDDGQTPTPGFAG